MNRILEQRYEQLTRREQGLLWTTLLFLFLTMVSEVVWPLWQQWQTLHTEQQQLYKQQQHLSQKQQMLAIGLATDYEGNQQARWLSLRQAIQDVHDQIHDNMKTLIPASKMAQVLTELLDNTPGLTLKALRSQAVVPMTQAPVASADESANAKPSLYQHRLELVFEGDYLATLRFMDKVDAMPEKVFWHALAYEVQDYPQAKITIEVFSLSVNKEFIQLVP
jgi:MSHA biogenesis protein MshJ